MARPPLAMPAKSRPGDGVSVVSPSWGGPGIFPDVHERGMRVLRDELGLVPVEYPYVVIAWGAAVWAAGNLVFLGRAAARIRSQL